MQNHLKQIALILFSISLLTGCQEEIQRNSVKKINLEGKVQKGPFLSGTSVDIFILNKELSQTGESYNTQLENNLGEFSIDNINFNGGFIELKANGYYFNEVPGENSASPLTLYALADPGSSKTVNVNVLTHITRGRVKKLMEGDLSFREAKEKATNEALKAFGMDAGESIHPETMDIAAGDAASAKLITLSVLFQGYRSVGTLSELLADLHNDFQKDGKFTEENIAAIKYGLHSLNIEKIKSGLKTKYPDKDLGDALQDFDSLATAFAGPFIPDDPATSFSFPEEGFYGPNLLSDSIYGPIASGKNFSLAVDLNNEDINLTIEFKKTEGVESSKWYYHTSSRKGWLISLFNKQNGFQKFQASGKGTYDLNLFFSGEGCVEIKYYKGKSDSLLHTKNVCWGPEDEINDPGWIPVTPIEYPEKGQFGINLLGPNQTEFYVDSIYSVSAQLPDDSIRTVKYDLISYDSAAFISIDSAKILKWEIYESDTSTISFKATGKGINPDVPIQFLRHGQGRIEGPGVSKRIQFKE